MQVNGLVWVQFREALVKGAERAPVLRWRFIDARPVSLGYSPLDAMHSALVFEVLTLSFERVDIE